MSPERGRQLWLVPVLLLTVIVTAVAGLLALSLYADPDPDLGAPEAVLPTQSSVPPSAQPGPPVVRGTPDAIAHPLFERARGVLQVYFDAINERDYQSWASAVTRRRVLNQPEEEWQKSFGSTRDGGMVIYRIEPVAKDEVRVLMTFTSTQDPKDAPRELPVGCIHWNVVFPLVLEGEHWKIDSGPTAASPQHEACA